MSEKKYSFSKEIAESLGIIEAIILDFFQNNPKNFSLDTLKNEFRFLDVSQIENSYKKLNNLGLFKIIPTKDNSSEPDETMNFYPSEDLVKQACNLGIEEDFLGDQLPSFNLFWKGKDLKPHLKESKFLQYALKNWREKEKIEYQESKKVLMDSNWQPSEDAISILKGLDINDSFIESLLPEFILFWKEKRIKSNSWNSTFLNHVKKQWAKKNFKLDSGKENHPMSKNWTPSEDCMKVLEVTNIPVDFIESKLPEFRLYWIDAGEISTNWNNKFINFVKNSWEKDSKKSSNILERLANTEWAKK
ncbi:DnaT-like ssDNA-binding domain-containing protein [SAR86 cluster bacterium]|nr:DnaT-like ssDNA-binding domain-containing protein [SAR86 cluster bacterium]